MRFPFCVAVLIPIISTTLASSGDRAEAYRSCVLACQSHNCPDSTAFSQPLALRLTRWTCTDDCKYHCMHHITDHAMQSAQPVQQYHGKWPFWRLAGMQEPASVAFSLLNLLAHARGLRRLRARVPDTHPMKNYYVCSALVSMNAWVWSSVFHTRDLPRTEKLDYFSAALAILYALYYTVRSGVYVAWTCICTFAFLAHISYLTLLPRFDYTYNMAFNLTVGMSHNLLWASYSLPASLSPLRRFPSRPVSYRPDYASKAVLFVLLTTAATALELFDFPPWGRVIDAHSLWHLSTVPIAMFWYDFLIQDAQDEGWRGQKS
ncbi:Per1-like protein [Amylocystis lapponica]|nr:Per1-like protein [Amylocystis lapponica]